VGFDGRLVSPSPTGDYETVYFGCNRAAAAGSEKFKR
jgi:hypothetical protein